MTQTSCVHEGRHVKRQVCPSTHSPSCTHARPVRDDTDSMCVLGRTCGKASMPLHTFSLTHTCMATKNQHSYLITDGLVGGPVQPFCGNWHMTLLGVMCPACEMVRQARWNAGGMRQCMREAGEMLRELWQAGE